MTKKEKRSLIRAVDQTIKKLENNNWEISFSTVAREIGVARSTLYRNPTARKKIEKARRKKELAIDNEALIYELKGEIKEIKNKMDRLENKFDLILEELNKNNA